jgi:hypothetical protein
MNFLSADNASVVIIVTGRDFLNPRGNGFFTKALED